MKRSIGFFCLLSVLALMSCAKRDASQDEVQAPSPSGPDVKPVVGSAKIGSQCETGAIAQPVNVPLALWECPGNFEKVTLAQEMDPIYFQADCNNGGISIRDIHGAKMSSDWYVMPDGSFSLTVDSPQPIMLVTDHAGHDNCPLPSRIDAYGKLDCIDKEHPVIELAAEWKLGRPTHPDVRLPNQCELPSTATATATGCYLYMETTINQCQ